jgi:hypothetical protein
VIVAEKVQKPVKGKDAKLDARRVAQRAGLPARHATRDDDFTEVEFTEIEAAAGRIPDRRK